MRGEKYDEKVDVYSFGFTLKREGVTAFELLHRPDVAERLEAAKAALLQALGPLLGQSMGAALAAEAALALGAFGLPATSKDAALSVTLPPGSYSVRASGTGATTGVALVEVYEVP